MNSHQEQHHIHHHMHHPIVTSTNSHFDGRMISGSSNSGVPRQEHTQEMDLLNQQANRLVDKANTVASMKSPRFQTYNSNRHVEGNREVEIEDVHSENQTNQQVATRQADERFLINNGIAQVADEGNQYTFQSSRAELYENRPLQQQYAQHLQQANQQQINSQRERVFSNAGGTADLQSIITTNSTRKVNNEQIHNLYKETTTTHGQQVNNSTGPTNSLSIINENHQSISKENFDRQRCSQNQVSSSRQSSSNLPLKVSTGQLSAEHNQKHLTIDSSAKMITDSMLQKQQKQTFDGRPWNENNQSCDTNLLDSVENASQSNNKAHGLISHTLESRLSHAQEMLPPFKVQQESSHSTTNQVKNPNVNQSEFRPQPHKKGQEYSQIQNMKQSQNTSQQQYQQQQMTNPPNDSIIDYLQPNQQTTANDQSRLSHLDYTRMNDSALAEQRFQKLAEVVQPSGYANIGQVPLRSKSPPKREDESYLQNLEDGPSANQILLDNIRAQQRRNNQATRTYQMGENNKIGDPDFVSVSPKANSSTFPSKTHQPVIKRNSSSRSSLEKAHRPKSLIGANDSRNGEQLHSNRNAENQRSKSHRSVSSRRSRQSAMTENPKENDHVRNYRAEGVNQTEMARFKDFDQHGRGQNVAQNRASRAVVKNLSSNQYRADSPIEIVKDRFPDKFSQNFAQETQNHQLRPNFASNSADNTSQNFAQNKTYQNAAITGSQQYQQDINFQTQKSAGNQSYNFQPVNSSQNVIQNVFPSQNPSQSQARQDNSIYNHENNQTQQPHRQMNNLEHGVSPIRNNRTADLNSGANTTGAANNTAQNFTDLDTNLLNITQGIDQTLHILSGPHASFDQRTASENQFILEASFCAASDVILQGISGGTNAWISLTPQDKMLQFASLLQHMRRDLRLGGLIGINLLLKADFQNLASNDQINADQQEGGRQNFSHDILNVIVEELFQVLMEFEKQELILIATALEVLGSLHSSERLDERLGEVANLIYEEKLEPLKKNILACLLSSGYTGLQLAVQIAVKDHNALQQFVMEHLLQIRSIQRVILVPSILSQLNSVQGNQGARISNLAMLNRVGQLVWEAGGLPILIGLIEEGSIDRQLVASVLRTSGREGETLLLKLLKFHKNERVRMAAASVLSYRLGADPYSMEIQIGLENADEDNSALRMQNYVPGQVCRYVGPMNSLILEESDRTSQEQLFLQEPQMEVNGRDFLASLNRMLSLDNDYFKTQFDAMEERQDVLRRLLRPGQETNKKGGLLQNFNLQNVQTGLADDPLLTYDTFVDLFDETGAIVDIDARRPISDQIVRSLSSQLLKEESSQVQEVIAAAIGGIGLPEAQSCAQSLVKYLNRRPKSAIDKSSKISRSNQQEEPSVRCMSVWALGRLASQQTIKVGAQTLIYALSDPFFKVRTSACSSIAQFGVSECATSFEFEQLSSVVIPILVKLLKDGQLNKQSVAETIVLMGAFGEQTLVNILAKEPTTSIKMRICIVRALALSNVSNASIDFVIEILFKTARDKNAQLRKTSLLSLDILRKKSSSRSDQVTYLKAKTLLPFLYKSLLDKDFQVRTTALGAISNFGPQGELIFIEGVTKEPNVQIRSECARGLGKIGPSCFRTILLALHDTHYQVREAAEKTILKNMTPNSVNQQFMDKSHQRQSLICSIQEVLSSAQTVQFSQELIYFLSSLNDLLNESMTIPQQHYDDRQNNLDQLRY